MSDLVANITALITAISVLIGTIAAVYFKLRNRIEEVDTKVNSQYTNLFKRLDDMTVERDALRDKDES